MKNYEVFIIVALIAGVGLYAWKRAGTDPAQKPIGGVRVVSAIGSGCRFPLVGSIPTTLSHLPVCVDTCMIPCNSQLVETP